jgi:hypothetical protein
MRRIILIAILLFLSHSGHAQLLDNKINMYIGYNTGAFLGKESVNKGSFIFPSLYSNFHDLMILSFKTIVKGNQYYSFGVGFNNLYASGWETDKSQIYNNSMIKQYSLSPIIQIHNKYEETGIFNRITGFFEIAPTIGLSNLTLEYPLFDIQDQNGNISQPMSSYDIFYGIKCDVGFNLAITRAFGIYFAYSIQHNWINSKLYNDNQFSSSQLGLGLVIRFEKDKRYY